MVETPWWSSLADILTIVAALIAIFGIGATWLGRPRVRVHLSNSGAGSASLSVHHEKGVRPAEHFFLSFGALNPQGRAVFGHGAEPWFESLVPGDTRSITIYDPAVVSFSGGPGIGETRTELDRDYGFIVEFSWPRPLLVWRRQSRVVLWSRERRREGLPPVLLKGHKARAAYKVAMTPPD